MRPLRDVACKRACLCLWYANSSMEHAHKRLRPVTELVQDRRYFQCCHCAKVVGRRTESRRHKCEQVKEASDEQLNAALPTSYHFGDAASAVAQACFEAAPAPAEQDADPSGRAAAAHTPDDEAHALHSDHGYDHDADMSPASHAGAPPPQSDAGPADGHADPILAQRASHEPCASAAAAACAQQTVVQQAEPAAQLLPRHNPSFDIQSAAALSEALDPSLDEQGDATAADRQWKEDQAIAVYQDVSYDDIDQEMEQLLADQQAHYAELAAGSALEGEPDWGDVADLPVCEALDAAQRKAAADPEQHRPFTVRQAAAGIFHILNVTSQTFEAARQHMLLIAYGRLQGNPSPNNPNNRFPPSRHVCSLILGVPDLASYEVHLCPEGCCVRFGQLAGSPSEHLAACGGCALCECRLCGAARYAVVDGRTVAVLMCYLLHDVFKQFFLDADWYAKVAPARAQHSADWYRTPEGKRCTAALLALGYDLAEVRVSLLFLKMLHTWS